jgi:hypothetical protein
MSWRERPPERLTIEQAYEKTLNLEAIRPPGRFVADAETAQLLAHDREPKTICQLGGDRLLVFRTADEDAVRKRIRKLGYIVPPRE